MKKGAGIRTYRNFFGSDFPSRSSRLTRMKWFDPTEMLCPTCKGRGKIKKNDATRPTRKG